MDIIQRADVHKYHANCGRARTLDPRTYISAHLFKARTLCRSFALLGAEVYKQLIQEERYEHYRRIVFPNRTSVDNIIFAVQSPDSHLRAFPIEGIEFRLYPDGPNPSLAEISLWIETHGLLIDGVSEQLEGVSEEENSVTEQVDGVSAQPIDSARRTIIDTSKLTLYQSKLDTMVTRQLAFAYWLESSAGVSILQKLWKLCSHPARIYIVEPELMPSWHASGEWSFEDILSTSYHCKLASLIFEVMTRAQLDVYNLFWNARSSRFPLNSMEDNHVAQEALLKLRSIHIFISNAGVSFYTDSVGRFLMEFCKNLSHLTIELGECDQAFQYRFRKIADVLKVIPRVKALTLVCADICADAVREYMDYAKGTIEEFHMQNMDCMPPDRIVDFANRIVRGAKGLTLKRCSIVPSERYAYMFGESQYAKYTMAEQILTSGTPLEEV